MGMNLDVYDSCPKGSAPIAIGWLSRLAPCTPGKECSHENA